MHYSCLIVDDETELAKMTAEYFQMFDVSTAYACSAKECYSFLEQNTVDLILLDINLGDGSGTPPIVSRSQVNHLVITVCGGTEGEVPAGDP